MNAKTPMMKLGAFLMETGHHNAAWRHPDVISDGGLSLRHQIELTRVAEAAKFDLVFYQDTMAVRGLDNVGSVSRTARAHFLEPITLLSALAAVTENIGLVATATITYNEPYTLARQFASLDHLSDGRAGWNLVTSNNRLEAYNFSREAHPEHADRYDRANEYVEVVKGLWDSWEDDALVMDKAEGVYFDPAKLHVLNHKGKYFSVSGPLNISRPPQGYPVLVQAGASEPGRDIAARTAEVIFTAQQTLEQAKAFYADIQRRSAAYQREPGDIKIMPGCYPVVGRTKEEALEKYDELQQLVHPIVGVAQLAISLGTDLSAYPIDGPLPDIPETSGPKSRQALIIEMARRENLTIRELGMRVVGPRGHHVICGTPSQIADDLEMWVTEKACDGFNVMPALLPNGLTDFAQQVIPELQRRGLFRTEYEGKTLRENLGLKRPACGRNSLRRQG